MCIYIPDEVIFKVKTKLLEIQVQIKGIPEDLFVMKDERYYIPFVRNHIDFELLKIDFNVVWWEWKVDDINIYLFNDLFIWTSAKGKYQGCYSFSNPDLEMKKVSFDSDEYTPAFSIGFQNEDPILIDIRQGMQ